MRVTKWLHNRTGFRRILCYLFQFLLLRMEFIGFVFELFMILGNEFLYIRLLHFIPVKSYLAGRESFIDFFKPVPSASISSSSFRIIV